MPLDKSGSKKAFEKNLKEELKVGKPKKQALAIAFNVKGKADEKAGAKKMSHRAGKR